MNGKRHLRVKDTTRTVDPTLYWFGLTDTESEALGMLWWTACGIEEIAETTTDEHRLVTCQRCIGTNVYRDNYQDGVE